MEVCSGCGATADQHPYVGVAKDVETGHFAPFPVCFLCFRDPEHRTAPLKMHFFEARHAAQAVQAAEDQILLQPPE